MQLNYKWDLWYLPVEAINRIIRVPFQKYALYFVHDKMMIIDILIASGWSIIFILLSYWMLHKRDL